MRFGILLGIVVSLTCVAEEDAPVKFPHPYFPPPEDLSVAELRPLLAKWDAQPDKKPDVMHPSILHLSQCVPNGMRYEGEYVVRYANPEIQKRILDLYEAVVAEADNAESPLHGGEDARDYLSVLTTMAESTLSPRIYEYELRAIRYWGGGALRELYLAVVNPDHTLNYITGASLGRRGEKRASADVFYLDDEDGTPLGSVASMFGILSLMAAESPEVLKENRARVLEFIQRYVWHYATPVEAVDTAQPYYRWRYDYTTRCAALDVIECVGLREDAALADSIARDLPDVSDVRGFVEEEEKLRGALCTKSEHVYRTLKEREGNP